MYSAAMNEPNTTNEWVGSAQGDYDALRFVTDENPCPYIPGVHLEAKCITPADSVRLIIPSCWPGGSGAAGTSSTDRGVAAVVNVSSFAST